LLGSAYVRFGGAGDIHGVVNLDLDPNARGNPRGLTESHVDALYDILRRINGKRDHEAPLFLAVRRELITPECLALMAKADATNILSQPPLLELVGENREREAELERNLLSQVSGGRWLTRDELNAQQSELEGLRALRTLCMLLNGNHRIRAMLRIYQDIAVERDRFRALAEKSHANALEVFNATKALLLRVTDQTWRVLVYDGKNF
jgi:hypothetical protein